MQVRRRVHVEWERVGFNSFAAPLENLAAEVRFWDEWVAARPEATAHLDAAHHLRHVDQLLIPALDRLHASALALRASMTARARRPLLASRIKRAFRRALSDPEHELCRARLRREYHQLA